jgi:Glycosyl hydrolase family 47
MEHIHAMKKDIPGLYPKNIDSASLKFARCNLLVTTAIDYGIANEADSFYEYSLKIWISTQDQRFRAWYDISANALVKTLLAVSKNGKYYYFCRNR